MFRNIGLILLVAVAIAAWPGQAVLAQVCPLPPPTLDAPPENLTERSAAEIETDDQKMIQFLNALRCADYHFAKDRDEGGDWFGHVVFRAEPRQWYTMTITRQQWQRWQNKAAQWHVFEESYPNLHGNIVDRMEPFKGKEAAAIVDALAMRVNELWPNPVTGVMIDSMRLFETVTREIPVEIGDEISARLQENARLATQGPLRPLRADESNVIYDSPEDAKKSARKVLEEKGWDWRELDPKIKLNLSARLDLTGSAGAGLSLKPFTGLGIPILDDCRFSLDCGYDSKDRSREAEFQFSINLH